MKLTYSLSPRKSPDRRLQPQSRSARRARAAHLPEVRRSRIAQGRQSVPPAAVHQRVRARLRPLVDGRIGEHRALPPRHQGLVPRASSPSTTRIRTTTSSTGSTRTPATRRQTGVQVLSRQDVGKPWRVSGSVNWFQNDIDAFETHAALPDAAAVRARRVERQHVGPDAEQPDSAAARRRTAGELYLLRRAQRAAGPASARVRQSTSPPNGRS